MNKARKLQMSKYQNKLKLKGLDFEFDIEPFDLSMDTSVYSALSEWANLVNKSSRENRISNLKKLLNGKPV